MAGSASGRQEGSPPLSCRGRLVVASPPPSLDARVKHLEDRGLSLWSFEIADDLRRELVEALELRPHQHKEVTQHLRDHNLVLKLVDVSSTTCSTANSRDQQPGMP
jgi:hypothetical protein